MVRLGVGRGDGHVDAYGAGRWVSYGLRHGIGCGADHGVGHDVSHGFGLGDTAYRRDCESTSLEYTEDRL